MSDAEGLVLGISIGATKSCVAIFKDDVPLVVANDAGDRVTPCVTTLSGKENTLRVATRQELARQASLIHGSLHLLGRKFEEVSGSSCVSRQQCEVAEHKGMPVFRIAGEKTFTFTPVHAMTAVFAKLKESAKSAAGREEATACVIAVPVSFTTEQRKTMEVAAEKAGLRVLRMITEPASALLAYGIGQQSSPNTGYVLVYDMGATSVNVSIVSVMSGLYSTVASHTDDGLGGADLDRVITKHFATEFQRKWRMDMTDNKRSMAKLRAASEVCRQSLSSLNTAPAMVESLYDGMDFQSNLSRARFEGLCGPLLQQCLGPITCVLEKAGLTASAVSKVVVTGGCSRTPKLRQMLGSFFGGKAEVVSSNAPEEVIATGACLQANLIQSNVDRERDDNVEPCADAQCISRAVGIALGSIATGRAKVHPIFPVSTPAPSREKLSLSVRPDQTSATVTVCEHSTVQEDGSSDDVRPLLTLALTDLPVTDADKQVEIVLSVERNGCVKASAKELTSMISASVSSEPTAQNGLSPGD